MDYEIFLLTKKDNTINDEYFTAISIMISMRPEDLFEFQFSCGDFPIWTYRTNSVWEIIFPEPGLLKVKIQIVEFLNLGVYWAYILLQFIKWNAKTLTHVPRGLLFIQRSKLMKIFHLPVDKKFPSTFCRWKCFIYQ